MASGGWGCPHDENGTCTKRDAPCEPGEPGCVLEERMRPRAKPTAPSNTPRPEENPEPEKAR